LCRLDIASNYEGLLEFAAPGAAPKRGAIFRRQRWTAPYFDEIQRTKR